MNRWIVAAAIVILTIGCDSESTKNYELTGYWTFSGVEGLCDHQISTEDGQVTVSFEKIEIKIYKSEEEQEKGNVFKDASTPCSEHEFTVEDIPPGTYIVNVEAMAEDPEELLPEGESSDGELRAYFESTEEVVIPTEEGESVEFKMDIGRGSIEIFWDFEKGLCGANDVKTVSIELTREKDGVKVKSEDNIDCNSESWTAENLPMGKYNVTIEGFPEGETEPTHEGSWEDPVQILPGTEFSEVIELKEIED